jgi:pimeloyl-ACP methyl ester carboxylesterase
LPLSARFTVHALDLPGFGESPDVPADVSPDGYLDWVARAVQDVALGSPGGQVAVVGFSFGGVVAAAVTGRIGSLARRLSLIGPGGFGEPVGRSIPVRKRPKGSDDMPLLREVTAYNLGQWMLSEPPPADDPVIDLHLANLARARYDSRLIGWRPTLLPDLARTACPVQILWGDGDRLAHPSVQARRAMCQAARPDLQTAVIPDCGHWAQYARPEAIEDHLLAFHGPSRNDSGPN